MLKETETEETRLFVSFLSLMAFRSGGLGPPGYAYDCYFNGICDIKILCAFLLVCPYVHTKGDSNGFILYDHAKHVILFGKVKVALNSSCNLKL